MLSPCRFMVSVQVINRRRKFPWKRVLKPKDIKINHDIEQLT
jgi:hypothetical protein